MLNAVMWIKYAHTLQTSLDTTKAMNGLLKQKISNLDFSYKFCQGENDYLRGIVNTDNDIIKKNYITIVGLEDKVSRQKKWVQILLPSLAAIVAIETVIIVVK